jgi:glycosyl transferase family 1
MSGSVERSPNQPRILLFSHRNIYEREVWRCSFFEFENLITELDAVDVVAPSRTPRYRFKKSLSLRIGEQSRIPVNPGVNPVSLSRDYELFFTVCEKPSELLNLLAVKDWKKRCRTSVCWLPEFYVREIPIYKSCLEVLSQFDHVIFMFAANEPFRRLLKSSCIYSPAGIDALKFCPYPRAPARSIDVLSIGRRSEATHNALLHMGSQEGTFYVYDTMSDLHTFDLAEHRSLMANLAKRSRYFIVNPGKVNAPGETGGQSEFGYRYFEGAAPGAILIGDRPHNREFDRVFDWQDSVIHLPFGSQDIGKIMRDLDRQPDRQRLIRTQNVTAVLKHHDWAYRWERVLELAGLTPLPPLQHRKARLAELSRAVAEHGMD